MIVGKTNRKNLLELKGISRPTLSKKFKTFFDRPIPPKATWSCLPSALTRTTDPWVLAIDGKWLRRQGVVMIYRDVTHGENLFWSCHSSESHLALSTDLGVLVSLLKNNLPSGVISDWKGSIVAGVATYLGNIPHQRCLAHVIREVKRFLPKGSSFDAVLVLRDIARELPYIKTQKEAIGWKAGLIRWQMAYGHLLKEKSTNPETGKKWWYTHGDLRRAWRLLTDDWYPFFVHLDHQILPNTNNSLEGVNCQLKNKLQNHRGMKTPQQVSFLFWYLAFTRTKTKQNLKELWGCWKT